LKKIFQSQGEMNSKRLAIPLPQGRNVKRVNQTSIPDANNKIPNSASGFDSSLLPLTSKSSTGPTTTQSTTISRMSARLMMPMKTLDPTIMHGIPGSFFEGSCDVIENKIVT